MRASRNQWIVLGVLVVIALFALPRLFSGGTSASPSATPATTTTGAKPASSTTRAGRQAQQRPKLLPPSLDPALRKDLLAMGETYQYDGSKRDIFSEHPNVVIPDPIRDGRKHEPEPPQTPVVQGPPPIPLKFYGFATQSGQAKRVFLSSGDDVFVGTEGQVINKRYKIVKINPTSVLIEDILNNNTQPIPLTPATS